MTEERITWHNDTRRLGDLIPWKQNPKQLTKKQGAALQVSLDKFGLAIPLLISPADEIYDGHQRQAIMEHMAQYGADAVVDVRVSSRELTFDERRELVVRLRENQAGWDFEALANIYEPDELIEWGMDDWRINVLNNQGENDPEKEWEGLPEFENEDAFGAILTLKVHFETRDAIQEFANLVGQSVNMKTTFIWFPKKESVQLKDYKVIDES